MKVRRGKGTQLKLVRRGSGTVEYHYQTIHFYVNSAGAMVSVVLIVASLYHMHRTCITECMETQ